MHFIMTCSDKLLAQPEVSLLGYDLRGWFLEPFAIRITSEQCSSFILSWSDIVFKYLQRYFKGALSGLRQFLATESPLKTMKNVFYFNSKALFVLKIFKFLS